MRLDPTATDAGAAARFLPTLDKIREGCVSLDPDRDAPSLPPGEPTVARKLAAIVLAVRVIRRESRDVETEMSLARASYLLAEMPPAPTDYVEQRYLLRLGGNGPEGPCSGCDIRRPGNTACHNCGGSARVTRPDGRCPACLEGFILCATCDGSRRSVKVRVRHVDDVFVLIRDVFVPQAFRYMPALFDVPSLLRDLLEQVVPPIELASPIFGQSKSSAYRDATRKELDPVFHGHRFEDALEVARAALRSVVKPKSEIVLYDVRSYAWPFLWLEFGVGEGRRDSVYVVRPDGQMAGFSGA